VLFRSNSIFLYKLIVDTINQYPIVFINTIFKKYY
jgi:hypothetical protein